MTTLTELFTPRKNSQIRYATYDGFEGYVAASDDLMILFRTTGSLWTPVASMSELVILGLVSDAEVQVVLDTLAGGYSAIACNRRDLEV